MEKISHVNSNQKRAGMARSVKIDFNIGQHRLHQTQQTLKKNCYQRQRTFYNDKRANPSRGYDNYKCMHPRMEPPNLRAKTDRIKE